MSFYTSHFLILISTLFFILLVPIISVHFVSDKLRKKLNTEEENALCCMNNLPCCNQPPITTFEVKSIITDCPNLRCENCSQYHRVVVQNNKNPPEKLTQCKQKLLLTLKMINDGIPNDKSQYVIIDHITDSVTLKKVKILNPYAVRIRQEPVLQVYDLKFERSVNSEARETVFNKHNINYRGCNLGNENPTCGVVRDKDKIVPYSTGFCCSCNAEKNMMMEEHKDDGQWPSDSFIPEYHKNNPEENDYEHYKHYGFTGQDGKMVYEKSQKRADKSVNYQQFTELKDGHIRQRRGGQSCDDFESNSIPESLQESTHCLTFSNLWYSVYEITKPRIVHRVRIQIFQKYEDCKGKTHWMDLTQQKVIEIGTQSPTYIDKDFIAKYTSETLCMNGESLDYRNYKLLIPEKRVSDPEQFMMLPRKMISEDGKTCDTAGVGYEAFYKQKKRCSSPQGSCLHNQPQHLYESDLQAEQEGKQGQYFLKFFGTLAQDPIVYNSTGQVQFLKLVYTKKYVSDLYFELNADLVTLLKPNSFATITEAYTDATNPSRTHIVVKVTNSGLLYGVFYVRVSGCPLDVPASFNNIASKSVLIASQHQHIFNLYIEYPLPVKEFFCSVHVHNVNQELVALRQIRIHTYDRCICIWHCECACYVYDKGLKCTPMSLESYHAAGFQGGLPVPTHLVESSYLDELLAMLFSTFIFLVLTLLAMGLIKALLGLCSKEIGLWGLYTILGIEHPEIMCDNKECEYRSEEISLAAQFCLNYCFSAYTIEDECSCEERWIEYDDDDEDDEVCTANCSKSTTGVDNNESRWSMKYTNSEGKSTESKFEDQIEDVIRKERKEDK